MLKSDTIPKVQTDIESLKISSSSPMDAMTDARSDIIIVKSEMSSMNFKVISIEAAILNNTSMLTKILESVNGVNNRKRRGHPSSSDSYNDDENGCAMD